MSLFASLPPEWSSFLEIDQTFFAELDAAIPTEGINPRYDAIFLAFTLSPNDVKVVIIGQDPYPDASDACGLAFSISPTRKKIPGSLRNIKKELHSDLGIVINDSGDLSPWVSQGVLLLNRILTTTTGNSLAHKDLGWEKFTDLVIRKLAKNGVLFILWGKSAESVSHLIPDNQKIIGVHPSPLSAHRGFFGSNPFSECNEMLQNFGKVPIDWKI